MFSTDFKKTCCIFSFYNFTLIKQNGSLKLVSINTIDQGGLKGIPMMLCEQQLVKSVFKGLDEWVSRVIWQDFSRRFFIPMATGERYLYCNMLFVDST